MLEELNAADLGALASLAQQLVSAGSKLPGRVLDPHFLVKVMQAAVDVYKAGPEGEEAQRTAVQVALARLLKELEG